MTVKSTTIEANPMLLGADANEERICCDHIDQLVQDRLPDSIHKYEPICDDEKEARGGFIQKWMRSLFAK
jgi:hypothetical protein